jgi:hypothetical protein
LEAISDERNISSMDGGKIVDELVSDFLAQNQDEFVERIFVDKKREKLFLFFKHSPQRGIRSKEIVEGIFKIENPAFVMARERAVFDNPLKLT